MHYWELGTETRRKTRLISSRKCSKEKKVAKKAAI